MAPARPLAVMLLALCPALVALCCAPLAGCYLSHSPEDSDAGPDARVPGRDAGRDARVRDAGPDGREELEDAGMDAGTDAGVDGGRDGGPDAEPPVGPPPDPETCRIDPVIEPFDDPVLEYHWPTGEVEHADSTHVCSTPVVIDLDPSDGDRRAQLAFVSYPPLRREEQPGILRIVDPATNRTISYPRDASELGVLEATTNVAAGDIDGDGVPEIVGMGQSASTYAFRSDGTMLWQSPHPSARDRGLFGSRSISGAVNIADLEGDGIVEIIVGHNVMDGATGALRWVGDETTGYGVNRFLGPISCVADLDGDGIQEEIAGNTAFRANGDVYWQLDVPDGLCAVADVVATRAGPEVVLVSNGFIRVLDGHTGEMIWWVTLLGRVGTSIGGAPTIADFDGDGHLEFGVAHGAAYGVYDMDCIGPGMPAGCEGDKVLWHAMTADDSSSGTGSSVFDFNGDGRAEVIYNDQYFFRVYDGTTGFELFSWPSSSRTRTENPSIADVDDDGDAEIVFSSNAEAFFIRDFWTDPGVEIWGDARGRWVGARRIWNQHAYHITNVNEDGTIPSPEADSWSVLNAYRQNLREGSDVLVTPDLWGGHGTYECLGGDRVRLTVNVRNMGLERAGAGVVVAFYRGLPSAGDRIGEVLTTRTLEPRGDTEVVTFETTLRAPVIDYYAVLDGPTDPVGGSVGECREDNNAVLIWRPSCR